METDDQVNGWVYVKGGPTLFGPTFVRIAKSSGVVEDVEVLAGVPDPPGDAFLLDGAYLYLATGGASGPRVYRISTDGGKSFGAVDYMKIFGVADVLGMAPYKGQIFLTGSSGATATSIVSAPAGANALPVTTEYQWATSDHCEGLAVDDSDFYLACPQQQASFGFSAASWP